MRTRSITKQEGERCGIHRFPNLFDKRGQNGACSSYAERRKGRLRSNFHRTGSIGGMKKLYYGENALLVRCGAYIYNVSSEPSIYYQAR